MLNAAEAYLKLVLPSLDEWEKSLNSNRISAGSLALNILFSNSRERLNELPCEVWEAWLPGIIEPQLYITGYRDADLDLQQFVAQLHSTLTVQVFFEYG